MSVVVASRSVGGAMRRTFALAASLGVIAGVLLGQTVVTGAPEEFATFGADLECDRDLVASTSDLYDAGARGFPTARDAVDAYTADERLRGRLEPGSRGDTFTMRSGDGRTVARLSVLDLPAQNGFVVSAVIACAEAYDR